MSSRTTIEMARCFRDRHEALSLMHSAYVRAGLPSQSENALRVTRHQLLPRSRIFVAKADGRVVSTLSLIPDSPAGLPLDGLYRQPVDRIRASGVSIAEVGCFADRRQKRGRSVEHFCALVRFIAQYAVAQGIGGLVIAGHPQRVRFLKNILGFKEELGPSVAPAADVPPAVPLSAPLSVPLFLEFERLKREMPETYRAYFEESVPLKEFAGGFMPRWEADYFGRPCAGQDNPPVEFPARAFSLSATAFPLAMPTL